MKSSHPLSAPLLATAVAAALLGNPGSATACGYNEYNFLGSMCVTAASYCPEGYAPAEGQLIQINSNPALYSLLGTTYGGDGRSTFALPDLRGRTPVGVGQGPGLTYVPPGQMRGAETTTLSVGQLPAHNHSATFTPTANGGGVASGAVNLPVTGVAMIGSDQTTGQSSTPSPGAVLAQPGAASANIYGTPGSANDVQIGPGGAIQGTASGNVQLPVSGVVAGGTVTVGATGNGDAVPTVAPQIGLRYCISTNGMYPPRP